MNLKNLIFMNNGTNQIMVLYNLGKKTTEKSFNAFILKKE